MKKSIRILRIIACLAIGFSAISTAFAGATIDAMKKRGSLNCGVNSGLEGFSAIDSDGHFIGFDTDMCRAVAVSILGAGEKVNFIPLTAQQRFTALQSGEVDMVSRNTTWTLSRDASLGGMFAAVTYYDGQGYMVPKKLGVTSATQLKGATVCVEAGTTTEKNSTDYSYAHGLKLKSVVFNTLEAARAAYFSGRCSVYTTDASGLASTRNAEAKNPADHIILPEMISKEPLGLMVRRGDDEFFTIAKWVVFGLVNAEEYGITQANVLDKQKNEKDPTVMRMLGSSEDTGRLLGLDKDWLVRPILAVGNYGEIFERNVGPNTPLALPRGLNALWTEGGLMYAPPIR